MGTWNIRGLNEEEPLRILEREVNMYKMDVIAITKNENNEHIL